MEPRAFFCSFVVLIVLHTAHSKNTPPKITNPATKVVDNIRDKDPVKLECQAESTPKSTYQWKFQGEPVEADHATVNAETGDLEITEFRYNHEGNYQCLAKNEIQPEEYAVAMSAVITLRLVVLDTDWGTVDKTSFTAREGEYLNLTCENAPKSVPTPRYSWYLSKQKEVTSSASGEGEVKATDRIYIDAKGTLHFIYLKRDDDSGTLRYKCSLWNSILDLISLGTEMEVSVQASDSETSIPQVGAKNRYYTSPARFLRTKEAELECVFSGNPVPQITWKNRQGDVITPNNKYEIQNNRRKLIIKNLNHDDDGTYTCEGSNIGSPVKMSIYLEVTSGPIWVDALSSKIVPENKDAVFTCRARAINVNDVLDPPVWYKNGAEFNVQNDPKYEFSDNSQVLTVKNLDKAKDIMCFQCNVSNDIGYEFGVGCLTVIEPIVITAQPELEQHIAKGEQVNLTIIGKTDPDYTLQYRWYFKNVTYQSPKNPLPFVTYDELTKQAYINTSGLSEEDYRSINGTYIRELYHPDDKRNVSIDVILRELPAPVPIVAAGVDLWWIALIVALIVLIIVIILIVIICNRMRQEGTYPLDKKERSNDIDPEKDLADSGFQDLSRAPGDDDYPTKKSSALNPNFDYGDDDIGDDDESLTEYAGDFDTSKFNEEGSFIGQYASKNKHPVPLNYQATESQI